MKKHILDPLEKQNTNQDLFLAEREAFYNCLTKEQQLLVFCEVISRLTTAELSEGKTYRGILYETFGFDYDSYLKAQWSGFLELHEKIDKQPNVSLIDFSLKLLSLYGIQATPKEVEKLINKLDQ